jgi:PAS domain-containing protein
MPGLAEAACAGLALLCLLAPTWWMLEKGRAERLAELDALLRGAAESSAEAVASGARLAAAELRATSVETGTIEAAQSVLDGNDSTAHSRFAAAANRSLQRLASGAPKDFLLVDAAGTVLAESAPGTERIATVPPAPISPWHNTTGRSNGAGAWQIAVSLPFETKSGKVGWLLYSIDVLPLIDRELHSTSSKLLAVYAVSSRQPAWLLGEQSRAAFACATTPGQLLAMLGAGSADAASGANISGYDGCRGTVFGGWARAPSVGLSFVVETDAVAALSLLKATRLTTIGLAALLGALTLILILMQTTDAGVGGARLGAPRKNTAAWGILAVALLTTAIAGVGSKMRSQAYEEERIAAVATRLARDLEDRVEHYAQVLSASAAAYRVLPAEGRAWREFTEALRLQEGFAGFRCISVILASADAAQPGEQSVEVGGAVSPTPDGCPSTQPDETTAASLTTLAERSAGAASLAAGIVRWPASGGPREWLALMQPVSRMSAGGEAADSGWIVALSDPSVLLAGVADNVDANLRFALYEGDSAAAENLLFRSGPMEAPDSSSQPALQAAEFGGSRWTLAVLPTPVAVTPFAENYPFQVVLAGLAISVLLFDIALVLSSTRARAIGIAALTTDRFRESEERIRAVIDHVSDGIVAFDSRGRISTFNPGAEKLFGYSEEEAFGLRFEDLLSGWQPSEVEELSSGSPDILGPSAWGEARMGRLSRQS